MLNKLIAALLILILCPLLIIISIIILIQTGQNPIFIQERGLTLSKYRFKIYKFRTMYGTILTETLTDTLKRNKEEGSIFLFGRFLRKTGLDELPQLLNILKGEMNFVGPRPLDLKDLENIKNNFTEYYFQRLKIDLLPGLTGYWQVRKDETRSIQNLIELDKYYEGNKSVLLNINILSRSFHIALLGKNENSIIMPAFHGHNILSMASVELSTRY